MFEAKDNPGYETLTRDAKDFIVKWLQNDWYESSSSSSSDEKPPLDKDEL